MQCDLCGKEEQMFKTEIEGTIMVTCKSCSKFGKVIRQIKNKQIQKQAPSFPKEEKAKPIETIVLGYASLIKTAREKLGFTQKEFAKFLSEKESNIHSIESGHREPRIELARKMEKKLGIKLVEISAEEDYKMPKKPRSAEEGLTLGDFIKVRKR